MVATGFGSLTLLFCSLGVSPSAAEMPGEMLREGTQLISSAAGVMTGAQSRVTWHDSMKSGWAESKRRKVPMVIFITSGHCRFCDAMKRDTWCDREIGTRLASDFVAIRLTPELNASTLGRIKVETYPMTLIGTPEGKIIGKRIGYQPTGVIHRLLSKAHSQIKRR